MITQEFSVSLGEIIKEFNLELINGPENFEKINIVTDDINRPGLQLAGFFDYYDKRRIQIIGKVETTFVDRFTPDRRKQSFEKYFKQGLPCLIVTRNIEMCDECIEAAKTYSIPILRTNESTSAFMSALISYLNVALAQRLTMHGVLVEIYGEGTLILGDSGVGKSETAIELVKRGHRLIADDAVEVKKVSAKTLVGTAPEVIRHFIELRGIGIVDVRRIFGMGAIKPSEKIDLIINLEPWEDGKHYDRLGLDSEYTPILDIGIPSLTVPVKPGRNLAVIIEVAAMNNRHKKMGYNAARDLNDRMTKSFKTD